MVKVAAPWSSAAPLDLSALRRACDAALEVFLDGKARSAERPEVPGLVEVLHEFVFAGGKRIRPVLCVCGWRAAGGAGDGRAVLQVAAALEMFHTFALIHDDVMDTSATRRGKPTLHRTLAVRHSGRPDAEQFGVSAAVLLGDLAFAWSDELLHTAGLSSSRLAAALGVVATMRSEIMYGQYLDLLATGCPTDEVDHALAIVRYKTARYTVERPLHLGATVVGDRPRVRDALTAYALPLGEAFQLRDDVLGTFGDPAVTGKSVLDDLRCGKHTVLTALALQQAGPSDERRLRALLGRADLDEEGAAEVRGILTATGSRRAVEQMIRHRYRQALRALDTAPFPPVATAALREIAHTAAVRTA